VSATADALVVAPRSLAARGLRRPRWLTFPVALGLLIIVFWVVVALTINVWTPFDPLEPVDTRLQGPSSSHLMGTDALGRDVLSRTLHGSRASLPVAAVVIAIAVAIGCLVGAVSGFLGGWVDSVLMRASDMTLAFPPILLAMTVTASLGPGIRNALFAMVVVWWPVYARLLRAQVLAVKELDHVVAARATGAGPLRLMGRHIIPLSFTPILVNATMDFGQVVLLSASLSYIGLGAVPPTPEWGSMINEGAVRFYDWWIAAAPGIAILTVVLGFNFVGDGLRDFFDPRTRSR
jgi:peptide/nickel transport system permease protein